MYQSMTKIIHYIVWSIRRFKNLGRDQQYINKLEYHEEPKGAKFEQTHGRIAQVEAINAEHTKKYW